MSTGSSRPRLRLNEGAGGADRGGNNGPAILRGAALIASLLNPVIALATVILVPLLSWQRRIRPTWLLLASITATVVAVILGAGRAYTLPYRQIVDAVAERFAGQDEVTAQAMSGLWPALGELFASNWLQWITGQLPFGIGVAAIIAASVAAWRRRYDASWRAPKKAVKEQTAQRAVKSLPLWPQRRADSLAALQVSLGVDLVTGEPVNLPATAFGKHTFIDGPSGFGKTTDLITIMRGLVEAPAAQPFRIGLVFITMKPDPEITDAVRAMAHAAGRRVHIITEDGHGATTTYNPIARGTAAHARNVLIEAEAHAADGGFSEPHYRRTGERYALLCIQTLDALVDAGRTYRDDDGRARPWARDLHHVAKIMGPGVLGEHTENVPTALSARINAWAEELEANKTLAAGGDGLRQRFAGAAEGAAGAVLVEADTGLDLRSAIAAGDVILFNLDPGADAQAARLIGNLALQDYSAAIGDLGANNWHRGTDRKGRPTQTRMNLCVVDEFSALGGSLLETLFERARSRGAGVILATQVSAALTLASPSFKDSVIKNSNIKLLHQQDTNAEDYASLVGTDKTMTETVQVFDDVDLLGKTTRASGQGSLREVDQFRVHPNELRDLTPGQAIVLVKAPTERHRVQIRHITGVADKKTARTPLDHESQVVELEPTLIAVEANNEDRPTVDRAPARVSTTTDAPPASMPAAADETDRIAGIGLDVDEWGAAGPDEPAGTPPPEDDDY